MKFIIIATLLALSASRIESAPNPILENFLGIDIKGLLNLDGILKELNGILKSVISGISLNGITDVIKNLLELLNLPILENVPEVCDDVLKIIKNILGELKLQELLKSLESIKKALDDNPEEALKCDKDDLNKLLDEIAVTINLKKKIDEIASCEAGKIDLGELEDILKNLKNNVENIQDKTLAVLQCTINPIFNIDIKSIIEGLFNNC